MAPAAARLSAESTVFAKTVPPGTSATPSQTQAAKSLSCPAPWLQHPSSSSDTSKSPPPPPPPLRRFHSAAPPAPDPAKTQLATAVVSLTVHTTAQTVALQT